MSLSPESLCVEASRRSTSSNSSSTAPPSELTQVDEDYKKYESSITESKPLPLLPSSISDEFNPYFIEYPVSHPPQSPIPPLTTVSQLAYALGPDNIPHTTEIDTVPCAGIRIPHGALIGLLAWRLVVRLAPPTKEKRGWWNDYAERNNYSEPMVLTPHYRGPPISYTSVSTLSLPLFTQVLPPPATRNLQDFDRKVRPSSVILTRQPRASKTHPQPETIRRSQPQSQLHQTSPPISDALAVNFILDTSLPYSIISWDTLTALGYPPPSILHLASTPLAMVTLSIQNIPTRFHIARPNEASRLGVQFLHDAGVSVFFPKDGLGVGPVLYVESAHLLKDVPRTISLQKLRVKLTVPQRVRALFGYQQRDR